MKKFILFLGLFFLGCVMPIDNVYQKNFVVTTQEDSRTLNISISYKTDGDNCRFITLDTIEEVVEYRKEVQFLLDKLEETEARFNALNSELSNKPQLQERGE